MKSYDLIVVGGGHAGCEAAHAAATMGSKVLLITMNMTTIAQMSCNPAMGGVAKGQIIREIDALGGLSGQVTDASMIQFRMLNRSKGPAVWSPRSQNDRLLFANIWRLKLEANPNISFWQEMVTSLVVKDRTIKGVRTSLGLEFWAKTVILTNGTFLNGIIHIGAKQLGGGRMAERSAKGLTEQLSDLGFKAGRMKTGTPPRVDGRTLNYAAMEEQKGDSKPAKFSFSPQTKSLTRQRSCHITYTNPKVHSILERGFADSPMFTGRIKGLGPRYCPSIEDKISRFAERSRHQIFVEPEGWETIEVYVNGFSTSLDYKIQLEAIRCIAGFEEAKLFRPGYAIEYDYFPPTQLKMTLETQIVKNLFFAGQINGTTGYEEAACQGLIAGINAHHNIHSAEPFILSRAEAYIGVLIDDLIHKGTEEPYRMFTSRAEHRLLLRQDNADLRLTAKGYKIGLAGKSNFERVLTKAKQIAQAEKLLKKQSVQPDQINSTLEKLGLATLTQAVKAEKLLLRPQIQLQQLLSVVPELAAAMANFGSETITQVEIATKYRTYIAKEEKLASKINQLDHLQMKPNFDYGGVKGLSNETREKLGHLQPQTLGQVARTSGIRMSDVEILHRFVNA